MNLFLTEDGVLKLGYYGLTTQAECYSIRRTDCDGVRSFAPEVFEGVYEMKSDVWSFGIALLELMGIGPYDPFENNRQSSMISKSRLPYFEDAIESEELAGFVYWCFVKAIEGRSSVKELMDVSEEMRNDE